MKSFSLRSVKLRSGEEYRDGVELDLAPLDLAGQRYLFVPAEVPAELAISRASTGTVFQLGFQARLHGPCMRCLADAVVDAAIDTREYQATNPGSDEELTTPYLADDSLDLASWGRDAVILALPDKILCRPECAGLCPVCGRDLNVEPHEHEEEPADSRWGALAELRDKL